MHPKTVFGLVRKYGILDLSKIALSYHRFSRFFFESALRDGRPYFGEYLGARQGVLRRHTMMSRFARREFSSLPRRELKILEVGSYAGASAITWALAMRESGKEGQIFCVDPWAEYLGESAYLGQNRKVLSEMAAALRAGKVRALFDHNIRAVGVSDSISPIRGVFREVAKTLPSGSFDLIYIDGNHAASEVRIDLAEGARLLREGGILCGDDLELQIDEVNLEHCQSHSELDVTVDPDSKINYHPGVTLAVGEYFKKSVSVYNGFFLMRKNGSGWTRIADLGAYSVRDLPPHLRWWNLSFSQGFTYPSPTLLE